ncbi:MAG: META domain-containing protein [Proteobacteria bacterium]|nr:META domain-containing protein [Pseudomonadota bacterium]
MFNLNRVVVLSALSGTVALFVLAGCDQGEQSVKPGETPAVESSGSPIAASIEPQTAQTDEASMTLFGTKWLLREVNGETVTFAEGQKVAFITFMEEEGRIHGFGGCNVFNGSFEIHGEQFTFGPMMSTMMACGEDDIEPRYLQALEQAERFVVQGSDLIGYRQTEPVLVFSSI